MRDTLVEVTAPSRCDARYPVFPFAPVCEKILWQGYPRMREALGGVLRVDFLPSSA